MIPFVRPPAPELWLDKEQAWLDKCYVLDASDGRLSLRPSQLDPFAWRWAGRSLREHFAAAIFAAGDAHCAYCDGLLGTTSDPQIDHFIPRTVAPFAALAWPNLFPACSRCNTVKKGQRWSCNLVRPDLDPVAEMFVAQPTQFGVKLAPNPCLCRRERARVRLTIRVFGLNDSRRMKARGDVLQLLTRGYRDALPEYRYLAAALPT